MRNGAAWDNPASRGPAPLRIDARAARPRAVRVPGREVDRPRQAGSRPEIVPGGSLSLSPRRRIAYRGSSLPASPPGVLPMSAVPLSRVAVQLRPEDNVAVAARHLQPGT